MPDVDPIIVVIDDDEVVRDSLKVLFETRRFVVQDFASARAFLAARQELPAPSCVVLDIHMPDMNGLELLRELRSAGDDLPVILVTGRREPAAQAQAQSLGAIALLDKPISHPALFAAIDRAMKRA